MADKTVRVRLEALTSQYTSAMARAAGASKAFGASLGTMGRTMSAAGTRMMTAGRTATTYVTLPLVAAGAAAVKAALSYDQAFTRINAVTNTSAAVVGRWKDQVLALSGATAQAPQDLAEALYFLASAGLDANQIMPALEASARGAAIGMGTTATNARLVANVLNAFPEAGLRAADVMDTLAAAIREGTAEPDEFTAAMGRLLPIAAEAGVGFDQLAASLAGLSNIGLDVNEGTTAMRGLLQALVAPGTQAAETMNEVGVSADQLRRAIAEQGVLGALRLLDQATGGNIDQLRKIIPNIRALTGLLGLTGQDAAKVDEIFRNVAGSTGDLGDAFAETSRSDAFQMAQSLNDLKIEAIELGQRLLPIGLEIVSFVSDLAQSFSELSPATQDLIIKLGIAAAAFGPLAMALGGLLKLAGGAFTVLSKIGTGIGAIAAAGSGLTALKAGLLALARFVGGAAIIAGLVEIGKAVFGIVSSGSQAAAAVDDLDSALRRVAIQDSAANFQAAETALGGVASEVGRLNAAITEMDDRGFVENITNFADGAMNAFAEVLPFWDSFEEQLKRTTGGMVGGMVALTTQMGDALAQTLGFAGGLGQLEASTRPGSSALREMVTLLADYSDAGRSTVQATEEQKLAFATLLAQYEGLEGTLDRLPVPLSRLNDLIAGGGMGNALMLLAGAVDAATLSFQHHLRQVMGNGQAYERWGATLTTAMDLTRAQRMHLGRLVTDFERSEGAIRGADRAYLIGLISAGMYGAAVRALGGNLRRQADAANRSAGELQRNAHEAGELGHALRGIPKSAKTKVDADTRLAQAQLRATRALVRALNGERAEPEVDVDTAAANAALADVKAGLRAVGAMAPRPTVSVNDNASGLIGTIIGRLAQIDGMVATATVTTVYQSVQAGVVASAGGQAVEHAGGIIGGSGARRLHAGGAVGYPSMRGDERLIVGQVGERMQSRSELAYLRRVFGGGGAMSAAEPRPIVVRESGRGSPSEFRGKITITDWDRGRGYIEGIAEDVVDREAAFQRRLASMGQRHG